MSTHDQDFAGVALPDHLHYFGRTVTVLPPDGPPREVKAVIEEDEREIEREEFVESELERVWLTVRRDESHADGGVASPVAGLAFRHPDESADSTPFAYQGQRRNVTPYTWDLLFARDRPHSYGRSLEQDIRRGANR